MGWQIIRAIAQYQIGASKTYQIIRAPSGPRGQAAGQDVGWLLKGGLGAGETLSGPPLAHAATFTAVYAHSDSGFAEGQTLTLNQLRAGSVIASASLAVTASGHDWSANLATWPFEVADVAQLVLPNPADSQATDLSVTLGSTP